MSAVAPVLRFARPRYATYCGNVFGVDDVDAERLLTVKLASGKRLLAPAGSYGWELGDPVQVLVDLTASDRWLGLAARPAANPFVSPGA